MAEEIYEGPRPKLSQGDILASVPGICIRGTVTRIEKGDNRTYHIANGLGEGSAQTGEKLSIAAGCRYTKAILITHDCEIDKEHVKTLIVCPVLPLSSLASKSQDLVRRNRVYSRLHLPRYREALVESFVDLAQFSTIEKAHLANGQRILSLSDLGRHALYLQLIRWLTRWEFREVLCPRCGIEFSPTVSLPVRSD